MSKNINAEFMPTKPLETAVLFLVFNRPDTTQEVFNAIRQAQPPRLYIAADGARTDKVGEVEKVEKVRIIATDIDWKCDVKTLFNEKNYGCGKAVSHAITWFFDNEDQGIILEDDCLPCQSFFWFCEELLEKYKHDTRMMQISGDNCQSGKKRGDASYYFSRYNHIWGWASWRRAWQYFDSSMTEWPSFRRCNRLYDVLDNKQQVEYWDNIFELMHQQKIDTWDYPWTFACWLRNGLTILPNVNFISNIGFGIDATHTTEGSVFSNVTRAEIQFPLTHPLSVVRDVVADKYTHNKKFKKRNVFFRIWLRLRNYCSV